MASQTRYATRPSEIKYPKLLVVEGKDDELFFAALCQHLGLNDLQVLGVGGKTKSLEALERLTKVRGFSQVTSLGVILDADNDPSAAFRSVCSALQNAGLPIPSQPMTPALGHPCVAIMILPDHQSPGALEDVCLRALAGTTVMRCIDGYFDCLRQQNLTLSNNLFKAKVLAYLTSQPEPDKRLGESAQAGYWNWIHPTFDTLKNFLRSL